VPIFDYSCAACGHTFDVLQKLGAEPLTECPECHAAELRKLVSAPAFHLRGKGWKNSDDTPKRPNVRPKFAHTMDSPVPHAEHSHEPVAKPAADGHSQGPQKKQAHGHSHSHSHDHGHSHGHSHGHKHD